MNQHITYKEHLLLLLGPTAFGFVDNIEEEDLDSPGSTAPKQSDPSVRNEFAVAGYRWGHPQIMDEINGGTLDSRRNGREEELVQNTFSIRILSIKSVQTAVSAGMLGDLREKFQENSGIPFKCTFSDPQAVPTARTFSVLTLL